MFDKEPDNDFPRMSGSVEFPARKIPSSENHSPDKYQSHSSNG